jgi:hypothetical protein
LRRVLFGHLLIPLLRVGNTFDYETGTFANQALFTMLSFRWLQGNPRTVLSSPTSIVLSEKLAKKYFGWLSRPGQPA